MKDWRLEAFEMWCWRRMFNISWKRKISNEEVLKKANETRRLLNIVKRRKIEYFGHILRHNEMLRVMVEGKINGVKVRGRQERKKERISIYFQNGNQKLQITKFKSMWSTYCTMLQKAR